MIVLGSTGSIGVNTLAIAEKFQIPIEALVCGDNTDLLNKQLEKFKPKFVAIANKKNVHKVNHPKVYYGIEGILRIIQESESKLVVNALVGIFGLRPTLEAIRYNKNIALANKESLVVAGNFIQTQNIIPIDSEHFGIWYLLKQNAFLSKITITASGGALRDMPIKSLKDATIKQVLAHPNWSMGKKITIDSATMANKLFEILEAFWLFKTKSIDAVIDTKSLIHALVHFQDGSLTAHIAKADMQLPIAYAVCGSVACQITEPLDLIAMGSIKFKEISLRRYPLWSLKNELLQNPKKGVIVNAANEIAVNLFLDSKIPFNTISEIVLRAYEKFYDLDPKNIEDIFEIDTIVRNYCRS